jgi:uncharacterized protein YndB with AHSA1/START domain
MKTLLVVVAVLCCMVVLALLVFYIAGSRMPREHRSQLTATFAADRPTVWRAITDYDAMPQWWAAVRSVRVERLTDGTVITWNRDAHGNEIPFKTAEMSLQRKLVRVIVPTDQPFGGTWTFELADAPAGGTTLTLTEDGWIQPPIFRAVSKWIVGLDSTQRDFIASLGKHLAGTTR